MRLLAFLLCILPLSAQPKAVPCEPDAATLRLLESVPPVTETSLPYEQRVGALRRLAESHPQDFFIERAYQDSFRLHRTLADEFDRALARYRAHPADPLSKYWEARLLQWHDPVPSRQTLEEMLRADANFVWPHLDLGEWNTLPGRRDDPEAVAHFKAFRDACPEGFVVGMTQDAAATRRALERRNSPLELRTLVALWRAEEDSGLAAEERTRRVRADLERMEGWPFRAYPEWFGVYREAARILKDPSVPGRLRAKADREAPHSILSLQFAQEDWNGANPQPDRNAPPAARTAREEQQARAGRAWMARWPDVPELLTADVMNMNRQAMMGEAIPGSAENLAVIDRALHAREASPDANEMWPAFEIPVARVYVAMKTRLVRVADLLGTALQRVQKQARYDLSPELFPASQRGMAADWPAIAANQVEEIRVDYLLALNRPADARVLIIQALDRAGAAGQPSRVPFDRGSWMRRLAEADAQDGRVQDALTHYQAAMAGIDEKMLAMPQVEQRFAPVKRYYLAHGGSGDRWIKWATAGSKERQPPRPRSPEFVSSLPDFSADDLAGKTWQLKDLKGRVTLVNFWATWCGPCRGEHPAVEELMQRIKGRADIQVLTISVDEHATPVTEYMKEKGYTFPVIHAPQLADKLFPYAGLPTNFLVNAKGMRSNMYGFGADSASVQRAIEDMIRAAK